MSKKDERRDALLRFIRRRSGRRFTVAVMAREFGVSVYTGSRKRQSHKSNDG